MGALRKIDYARVCYVLATSAGAQIPTHLDGPVWSGLKVLSADVWGINCLNDNSLSEKSSGWQRRVIQYAFYPANSSVCRSGCYEFERRPDFIALSSAPQLTSAGLLQV